MRLIGPDIAALAARQDVSALVSELDRLRNRKLDGFWGRRRWARIQRIIDALAGIGRPALAALLGVVVNGEYWVKRRYAANALGRMPGAPFELTRVILAPPPFRDLGAATDRFALFTYAVLKADIRTRLLAAWALEKSREPEAPGLLAMCRPVIDAMVAAVAPPARQVPNAGTADGAAPAAGTDRPEEGHTFLERLVEDGVEFGTEAILEHLFHPGGDAVSHDVFHVPDDVPLDVDIDID